MALDSLLSFMNISIHNIDDNAHTEIGEMHSAIDAYYSSVMTCISNACKMNLPVRHVGSGNRYAIAGWNDYIHEKHNMARNAYMQWIMIGRPRCGQEYMGMRRTRAQFKLALRYCKQHEEMIRADAL